MTRDELEAKVCRVLAALPPTHSMRRYPDLANAVGLETGGTLLASVIGTLRTKGYVERRPARHNEPGARYRLTPRGRLATELLDLLEGAA